MATFAMMDGNMVTNIIVGENKEELESLLGCRVIEFNNENPAGPRWTYDEETGTFQAPPELSYEEQRKQEILQRLGMTEEEFVFLSQNINN